MRIVRSEHNIDESSRIKTPLYNCTLYIRSNLTVSSASEPYYKFVGENSMLPFTDLIDEEDAAYIREAVTGGCEEPAEVFTVFFNKIEEGWRNVYVRVERCERTENGEPLYLVTINDIVDTVAFMNHLDKCANKYRYYMSIKDEYYFEYYPDTNNYKFYKYVNGKSIMIYSGDYDEYTETQIKKAPEPEVMKEQSDQLTRYLKSRNTSFEMNWRSYGAGSSKDYLYRLIGGVSIYNPDMVTGLITAQGSTEDLEYFLTSAGKDSFTGLLNKKAFTEYSIEKIANNDEGVMWMIIIDIDNFKETNDTFGHTFGDAVIKKTADTLQMHLGSHGVVGRFGGDEFVALVHDVPTRDELKLLLKVIARELMYAFDDKMMLTMSIGVSQYPKDGREFDVLFGKADKSLYIAKEKGKNRHIIYDEKLHGGYSEDSIKYQTVSFMISREKRRGMLVRCISEMNANGIDAFLENDNLTQGLLDLFDLGGITIFGDQGRSVIFRKGAYKSAPEDRAAILNDGKYAEQYDHETVMVISTVNKLKMISDLAYSSAMERDIGASVRCVVKKESKPYIFVDFDVFVNNRKWSDADVEILTVLGCMIGEMLKAGEQLS